jgi:hypothetical protein
MAKKIGKKAKVRGPIEVGQMLQMGAWVKIPNLVGRLARSLNSAVNSARKGHTFIGCFCGGSRGEIISSCGTTRWKWLRQATNSQASTSPRGSRRTRKLVSTDWSCAARCWSANPGAPGLVFSWSAGGLEGARVSFRLEPDGEATRVLFEHSGFDVSQAFGIQALRGAEFGWAKMLKQLPAVVAGLAAGRN